MAKYGTVNGDFRGEAERVLNAAKAEGIQLRLLGALAFNIHCPKFSYMQEMLGRSFTDLDFASYGKFAAKISKLFAELGYEEDLAVTRLFGNSRLVFNENGSNKRHCDVFFDKLEFCHVISFQNRLEADDPTLPTAELLLEKMQIVKLNQKDIIDTIMLLREHELGDVDHNTLNAKHIAHLCAADWGLWKTITTNLDSMKQFTSSMDKLPDEDKADVITKIDNLLTRISAEPKATSWKLRARIGEKKKWYRDVEELSR